MVTKQIGIRIDEILINKYKKKAKELGVEYTDLMRVKLAEVMEKENGKN